MNSMARRMFELVEPIDVIPYSADEPNEAMFALGFTSYWDTYFAGRAAPLGLAAAEVVDALSYSFAPGELARHIPKVCRTTTPEAAIAARQGHGDPVAGRIHALLPGVRGEDPRRQVHRFDEHTVALRQSRERWTSAGHVP